MIPCYLQHTVRGNKLSAYQIAVKILVKIPVKRLLAWFPMLKAEHKKISFLKSIFSNLNALFKRFSVLFKNGFSNLKKTSDLSTF